MPRSFPDAPWHLHGSMWVSLFWLGGRRHPTGRAGLAGVAWVDYREPSPLTYGELLLAVPVGLLPAEVRVYDIWVDSPASRDGGRELWAIPKGLADLTTLSGRGRVRSTHWSMSLDGVVVARARFRDLSAHAPRAPYAFATRQPPLDGGSGSDVVAPVRGSARILPCRSHWQVDPAGPLGRLAGVRPLTSVCLKDFALAFG